MCVNNQKLKIIKWKQNKSKSKKKPIESADYFYRLKVLKDFVFSNYLFEFIFVGNFRRKHLLKKIQKNGLLVVNTSLNLIKV